MHFTKHTLNIVLLLCIATQVQSMHNNKRKRDEVPVTHKTKHRHLVCAPTLPDEMVEHIIVELFHQNPKNENAIPCVSIQWNRVANSAPVMKNFNPLLANNSHYATHTSIRRAEWFKLELTPWSKLSGFKKYKEVNNKLWNQCQNYKSLAEIEETLKDPYANVNYPTWHANGHPQTPLYAAVEQYNPELVEFLIKNNADVVNQVPQIEHGLLTNSLWGKTASNTIDAHVQCLEHILKAGARDNGLALAMIASRARQQPKYYTLIPLFTKTNTYYILRHRHGNTALHELLDPDFKSEPNKEALVTLLSTLKANPHCTNKDERTAYDLANAWSDPELITLLKQHDSYNKQLTF